MDSKHEDWFKTEFGGDWDAECSKHFADALAAERTSKMNWCSIHGINFKRDEACALCLRAEAERVRRETLEEAARWIEKMSGGCIKDGAKHIRALADKG